jgi:hypothetical protein
VAASIRKVFVQTTVLRRRASHDYVMLSRTRQWAASAKRELICSSAGERKATNKANVHLQFRAVILSVKSLLQNILRWLLGAFWDRCTMRAALSGLGSAITGVTVLVKRPHVLGQTPDSLVG